MAVQEGVHAASGYTGEVKRLPAGEARGHLAPRVDYERLRLPQRALASNDGRD